jgi:hypothetical protein
MDLRKAKQIAAKLDGVRSFAIADVEIRDGPGRFVVSRRRPLLRGDVRLALARSRRLHAKRSAQARSTPRSPRTTFARLSITTRI